MNDAAIVIKDDELDEVVEEITETPEEVAPEPPKVEFNEDQQAIFNDQIGKKVAKQREAERKAEEAETKSAELERKLEELQKPARPRIPEAPDPYDDNFAEKMNARDNAVAAAVRYDTEQNYLAQMQAQQVQAKKDAEASATRQSVQAYSVRAEKMGIKPEDLQAAGNQVAALGIQNEVAQHILSDDQGAAITVYLAKNPLEMDTLGQMSPMQAAVYIETQVKSKAVAALQRRSPPPPEPLDTPSGTGFPPSDDLPGATFE